jgi:hypothetical protein
MSNEAVIELIKETLNKQEGPRKRRDNVRLWVQILGFTGVIFGAGWVGGMLEGWKGEVDKDRVSFTEHMRQYQNAKNEYTMQRINNIQTK